MSSQLEDTNARLEVLQAAMRNAAEGDASPGKPKAKSGNMAAVLEKAAAKAAAKEREARKRADRAEVALAAATQELEQLRAAELEAREAATSAQEELSVLREEVAKAQRSAEAEMARTRAALEQLQAQGAAEVERTPEMAAEGIDLERQFEGFEAGMAELRTELDMQTTILCKAHSEAKQPPASPLVKHAPCVQRQTCARAHAHTCLDAHACTSMHARTHARTQPHEQPRMDRTQKRHSAPASEGEMVDAALMSAERVKRALHESDWQSLGSIKA